MPLVEPMYMETGILSLSFNQDRTCVAAATLLGIRIFSADMHKVLYAHNVGAVSSVEMLFCTNLLAFVGAGEQPMLTPRNVTIVNTNSKKTIKDISFPVAVLSVKMNRKRLVVVLERKTCVYELESLESLRVLETAPNPRGTCALSTGDGPSYIALPASDSTGIVRIHDALVDGGNVVCDIAAHTSPVREIAINEDSTMIATASDKGTLVKVFGLPAAQQLFTLRRGSTSATIYSIAFSPVTMRPQLLAVSGSHGTIHVFKLGESGWTTVGLAASAAVGLLSAVTRYPLRNLVDPQRSIISVSLPNHSAPSICTIVPSYLHLVNEEEGNGLSHAATANKATLAVATLDGFFYEYSLTDIGGSQPKAERTGEWRLLGSRSLQ